MEKQCCVVWGTGLCHWTIHHPGESHWVWCGVVWCVCHWVWSGATVGRSDWDRKRGGKKILKQTVTSLCIRPCKICNYMLQYLHSICPTVHLLYSEQTAHCLFLCPKVIWQPISVHFLFSNSFKMSLKIVAFYGPTLQNGCYYQKMKPTELKISAFIM